jgi:hypothetical protein
MRYLTCAPDSSKGGTGWGPSGFRWTSMGGLFVVVIDAKVHAPGRPLGVRERSFVSVGYSNVLSAVCVPINLFPNGRK